MKTKSKLEAFAFLSDEIIPILEHLEEWDGGTDALVLANRIGSILQDKKRRVKI